MMTQNCAGLPHMFLPNDEAATFMSLQRSVNRWLISCALQRNRRKQNPIVKTRPNLQFQTTYPALHEIKNLHAKSTSDKVF